MVFYFFDSGLLSESDARDLLKEIRDKNVDNRSAATSFRRAVTYLAFKEMGFDK